MILYVDNENKIRDVNITADASLTPVYVDENDPDFPFDGWSNARICCYRVEVMDGVVIMMTPYVDSKALDHIDELGKKLEDKALAADILLGNVEVEE